MKASSFPRFVSLKDTCVRVDESCWIMGGCSTVLKPTKWDGLECGMDDEWMCKTVVRKDEFGLVG